MWIPVSLFGTYMIDTLVDWKISIDCNVKYMIDTLVHGHLGTFDLFCDLIFWTAGAGFYDFVYAISCV